LKSSLQGKVHDCSFQISGDRLITVLERFPPDLNLSCAGGVPNRSKSDSVFATATAAKPGTGHCRSPLEPHQQWLLELVAAEPDLTLDEIGTRLASAKRLKVGRTSTWRCCDRHRITLRKEKHCTLPNRIGLMLAPHAVR
jgi:hypothetical protein